VLQILYYSFESYSVLYTNATFSGVVLAVAPIVAIVFAIFFLREYPTRRQTIFCILPVVGVIWMTVAGNSLGIIQPKGLLFLILTCLTSAAFKTANRKAAQEFTSFERTYLVLAASAVCFTIFALRDVNFDMQTYFAPLAELPFVGSVLTLSILSSVGANLLVNYAVSKMSVVTFSSFGALTTLCSMFAGVVFLHEPMSASLLFGAVLILVGIYQVTRPDKAKIQK
jgi:drug/metabolite transporter (DMT)-like permease